MDRLNIFNSTLDACKDVNPVSTFQTRILVWNNSASILLTPFKAEFVDYMEFYIPVKDLTTVNKVKVIGTTIHKFKISR